MEALITIAVLVFSVILHEVAHGYAADALGDPTARLSGRLTLNPLAHLDPVGSVLLPLLLVFTHAGILFGWAKPVPYNPYNLRNQRWGEAVVAVAGSGTNLLIALVFAFVYRAAALAAPAAASFAAVVVLVNLFLGLFNLIPFPPLDGFTVLRGALPYRLSRVLHDFEGRIRGSGALALILFLIVFSYVLLSPFVALVSLLFSLLTGT